MEAVASAPTRENQVRFVGLDRQHARISSELSEAFDRLLSSSGFTLGREVQQFEHDFARYCEVAHCVGVSSGTAALSLMFRAHDIGPGDEVIVPAHTFIASALAVSHVGATPVLCDVQDDTGLIDPDAALALIGPRTVAILAVHLYGQACDMDRLRDIAARNGLLLLEDAAQAHGARYRGARVGSLGAAAAFSFYPSKNLGALGDGGAVCTSDETVAARLRRLRNLGQRAKGEHVELGYNARLDGLQAAFLRVKLRYLDDWNAIRGACAMLYRELLPREVRVVCERTMSPSVHHLFPVRVENRDEVARRLRDRGIETGVHYAPAMHRHPAWRGTDLRHGELSVAEAWAAEELSLPMHPELRTEEIDRVADAVRVATGAPGRAARRQAC